ncbi:P3 [Grapevine associated cogu-like virus 1]|uniref:Nucleoprotein n=1 Tax=Grapevine associated cogu-like virus 1 TaxID=2716183 RepID=A0A6G7M510_9VIRU|nr:P3 [Grapevine associated cogu-like virus 1]QIJ25706.1 P3 [Grapevine associated cogu-like virus 1]
MSSVNSYFDQISADPSKEKEIMSNATMELTGADLATLKKRIEGKKAKDKNKKQQEQADTEGSYSMVEGGETTKEEVVDISQAAIEAFWKELEKLDPVSLVSEDVLNAFKYVGFDPEIVLKELMIRGRKLNRNPKEIMQDMVNMVTIAIIKGSITEKNLNKTSDKGKVIYKKLKEDYNLHDGGTKGKDSTYVTVARVAAAVPGMVMQILIKKPEYSKIFVGPFGSKNLPPYLRHQAAAACIPETAPEKLKEYLLGLITAYTADQSKTLSKSKDTPETMYDEQLNFVITTHGSKHPSEEQRKKIFGMFSLNSDFEKLNLVATRVKKIKADFPILTESELNDELSKL